MTVFSLLAPLHCISVSVQGNDFPGQNVFVGVTLLNIESISPESGTFDADFYLQFQSKGLYTTNGCTCPYPLGREFCGGDRCQFCNSAGAGSSVTNSYTEDKCLVPPLFVNSASGSALSVQRVRKTEPAPWLAANATNQYRVQGRFLFGGEVVRNWPFEAETLKISLEDPNRDISTMRFVPLPLFSGVAPTAISPGWVLHCGNEDSAQAQASGAGVGAGQGTGKAAAAEYAGPSVAPTVCSGSSIGYRSSVSVATPGHTGNFSRFTFSVVVSRPPLAMFTKTVLPPLLVLAPQYYSFSMPIKHTSTRSSIAASGLVSSILLHVSINNGAPTTRYLLFSDQFMTCVYAITIFNLCAAIFVLNVDARDTGEVEVMCSARRLSVRDLHKWAELIGWFWTPTLFLFPIFSLAGFGSIWPLVLCAVTGALVCAVGRIRQAQGWRGICLATCGATLLPCCVKLCNDRSKNDHVAVDGQSEMHVELARHDALVTDHDVDDSSRAGESVTTTTKVTDAADV